MSDTSLLIETPENLTLEADIAGFGSRCMAALFDYTIILFAEFVLLLIARDTLQLPRENSPAVNFALVVLAQFIIFFAYHLVFEFFWNGQTPGKRRLHVRVVRQDGLPVTPTATVIRNFVRLFDFLPIFYGVGFIALFVTKRTQRLGDLAAGTIVIREHPQVTLTTIQEDQKVHYVRIMRTEPVPQYIQIDLLSEEDRAAVSDYLRRRTTMAMREPVAGMLAKRVAVKMGLTPSENELASLHYTETLLEYVARAFELR